MSNLNYNDNSITITGCHDCPFCHWEDRCHEYNPYCSIDNDIFVETDKMNRDILKKYFPKNCKLRNQNFKFIRDFGE